MSETKADPATAAEAEMVEEPDPRFMAGETVVFKTDKHWFAPVADSGMAILAIIGSLVLAWLQTDQTTGVIGFGNRVLNLVEIALFLFGVGSIIYNIIAWRSAKYLVTNFRILGDEGLLRKRSTDTLLQSISDVRYRQSAIGKALGFGDVQILSSSGEAGADKFTTVVKADVLKKTHPRAEDRRQRARCRTSRGDRGGCGTIDGAVQARRRPWQRSPNWPRFEIPARSRPRNTRQRSSSSSTASDRSPQGENMTPLRWAAVAIGLAGCFLVSVATGGFIVRQLKRQPRFLRWQWSARRRLHRPRPAPR